MTPKKNTYSVKNCTNERAEQLARAQSTYRDRLRENDFQRLQEWLPQNAYSKLSQLCEESGLTKREALERMISAADEGVFELGGISNDN